MVDFKCKSGRDVEICIAVPEIQTVYRTTTAMRQGTITGVRVGGVASPPVLKNFSAKSVFRASACGEKS